MVDPSYAISSKVGGYIMMDMFKLAAAMQYLYNLGYQVKSEHIVELNVDQYEAAAAQGFTIDRAYYQITRGAFEKGSHEMEIMDQDGVKLLMKAIIMILKMSEESGETFDNFKSRLDYCKDLLPSVITEPEAIQEKTPSPAETARSNFKVILGGDL